MIHPYHHLLSVLAAHKHPKWDEFGAISWILIGLAALAVVWTIWRAVRYTLTPGELEPDHIKRSILGDEQSLSVSLSSSGESSTTGGEQPADGA